MELEPETYIAGLHYNKVLPEEVKFRENRMIEEPDFGLMFIDEFGDHAFQIVDIHKVKPTTLFGYKMMALFDKCPANQRFVELINKMIQERPDKHPSKQESKTKVDRNQA
ncbi:hypothetical protein Tco_0597802 [Tanacetum coccineum]